MVGYNPKAASHLSHTQYVIAGALSAATSRAIFQPLDVLKIRFQLQVEPIGRYGNSKYQGVLQAVRSILLEEGLKGLWKGHMPAQALSIGFGIVEFASFEYLTKFVWKTMPESMTTTRRSLTHAVCGALAGSVATVVVQPMDVLRTRFIAQGEPKVYKTIRSAIVSILQKEGAAGFYRGLFPSITVVGPQMGLQFGFYSFFTSLWNHGVLSSSLPGSAESFICGSGAGFMSKIIVHPFDVIKKRLQIQGFEEARVNFGACRKYHSSWHCLTRTLKEEGALGLYKGLTPSVIKASLIAGFHLYAYEQICNVFIHIDKQS